MCMFYALFFFPFARDLRSILKRDLVIFSPALCYAFKQQSVAQRTLELDLCWPVRQMKKVSKSLSSTSESAKQEMQSVIIHYVTEGAGEKLFPDVCLWCYLTTDYISAVTAQTDTETLHFFAVFYINSILNLVQ